MLSRCWSDILPVSCSCGWLQWHKRVQGVVQGFPTPLYPEVLGSVPPEFYHQCLKGRGRHNRSSGENALKLTQTFPHGPWTLAVASRQSVRRWVWTLSYCWVVGNNKPKQLCSGSYYSQRHTDAHQALISLSTLLEVANTAPSPVARAIERTLPASDLADSISLSSATPCDLFHIIIIHTSLQDSVNALIAVVADLDRTPERVTSARFAPENV